MATRTTYTSTVTVPVFASWKCEHCGEVNFATGTIACQRQETTSSLRSSKQREAKENAANRARAEWAEEAYKIISDPNNNAQKMRSELFLQNTRCTKCGKKPRWDKDMKYMLGCFFAFPAIISGLVAFSTGTSAVAWIIFIASLIVITTTAISETRYKKMMKKLPKEYTPILGSLNRELIDYAEHLGKTIPNPDKCIEIVKGYDQISGNKGQPIVETIDNVTSVNDTDTQSSFCRNCGVQLHPDSEFCHKCGTEVVK